jgi:hypothetical protein
MSFQELHRKADEEYKKVFLATLSKDRQGIITIIAKMQFKPLLNKTFVSDSIFTADQTTEITCHVSKSTHVVYDALIEYISAGKSTTNINTSNIAPNLVGPSVGHPTTP